jgi:hypothetical protein
MPKNIHTPRDELICGKLDKIIEKLTEIQAISLKKNTETIVEIIDIVNDVRSDAERMEAKPIFRKQEAETLEKRLEGEKEKS